MSPKSASIIGDKVPAAQKEGREIETSGKVSREGNSETYLHQMPLKNFIGTVPKSQGDPKIVKRGPNGDPVLSKKGTKWGPF